MILSVEVPALTSTQCLTVCSSGELHGTFAKFTNDYLQSLHTIMLHESAEENQQLIAASARRGWHLNIFAAFSCELTMSALFQALRSCTLSLMTKVVVNREPPLVHHWFTTAASCATSRGRWRVIWCGWFNISKSTFGNQGLAILIVQQMAAPLG
jgi:hypothetical protein